MTDDVSQDFVDLIACLHQEGCDFIVVGAHALAAHGSPRATGDLDIFVRPTQDNANRVFRAILQFGAPVAAHGVTANDFALAGSVYQIGLPPFRIDILTEISGVTYEEASHDTIAAHIGDELVQCIGLDAMIRNKRATGRTKDLADAEALEEIRDRRKAMNR